MLAGAVIIAPTRLAFSFGDAAYAPAVFNASKASVSFIAKFVDGSSSRGWLALGSAAWQHIKGRQLVSLEVTRGAQKHTYSSAQLNALRRDHPVGEELWVIGEHGVTLDDRRDINTVRKRVVETHQ